jgi:dTDP-4-dehydrorhamnose reductase
MLICVCGASGLVGKELCQFLFQHNIPFIGTYNTNKPTQFTENMYKVSDYSLFLKEHPEITICINLIVQRLTDVCETNWNETKYINIHLAEQIAILCNHLNIRLIHLSTDYVFDGKTQPNYPNSLKNPLQNYGISKLIAEYRIQSVLSENKYCIIRIPVLYSDMSDIYNNAITMIAENLMDLRKIVKKEDNYCIRRPLFIKDLCPFILHVIQTNKTGIYHFYNPTHQFTKYEIAVKIANILNVSYDHIIPENAVIGLSSRPYDTQLMEDKLNMDTFTFTDFDLSLQQYFSKYSIHKEDTHSFFMLIDLDGTLIDSNNAHYTAYYNVFSKRQMDFISLEQWNILIQKNQLDDYLSSIVDNVQEIKKEKYEELKNQEIPFIQNADVFIKCIIHNKINCCIVTNTNSETCELFKLKQPLLRKIKNWITREMYTLAKPSSECYELAIQKFYNGEKYIIGIEDTHAGYTALKPITNHIYMYNNNIHNNEKKNCFQFNNYIQLMERFYINKMKIIVSQQWGGLGDNLAFSTLPELYSRFGYDVYLSSDNKTHNKEIHDLVWGHNPYIKGICDDLDGVVVGGETYFLWPSYEHNLYWIERIEKGHGFSGQFNYYPKIYYQPTKHEKYEKYIIIDITGVSQTSEQKYKQLQQNIRKYIHETNQCQTNIHCICFPYLQKEENKQYFPEYQVIHISTIYEYCDLLYSCNCLLTHNSGSHNLASAIRQNNPTPEIICWNEWSNKPEYERKGYFCFPNVRYITMEQ